MEEESAQFLGRLKGEGILTDSEIARAERALAGKRTALGFSRFERNVGLMRILHERFEHVLSPAVFKAALFYEAPKKKAKVDADDITATRVRKMLAVADGLANARDNPEKYARLLAHRHSVDAFLINAAAALHGLQRISAAPAESPLRNSPEALKIADTVMRVQTPTAGLLGLKELKTELGESAFRTRDPETYFLIDAAIEDARRMQQRHFGVVKGIVAKHARALGVKFEIKERPPKAAHSVAEKIYRKGMVSTGEKLKPLELVRKFHDIHGLKVIFDQRDPRTALDQIEQFRKHLESDGRVRATVRNNYLGVKAKPNGYEALHFTVEYGGYQGNPFKFDVHVQSREMFRRSDDPRAKHELHKYGALPAAIVAAIEELRGGFAPVSKPRNNITVSVFDGLKTHKVEVVPGAPVLEALAKTLSVDALAGGLSLALKRGERKFRLHSIGEGLAHGDTILVARDQLGIRPTPDWRKIVKHDSVNKAIALSLRGRRNEKRRRAK